MSIDRHRMAFLTWIVIYPLVTGLLALSDPILSGLAMPLKTFVLTAILVPVMAYLVMPVVTARLASWLHRPVDRDDGQASTVNPLPEPTSVETTKPAANQIFPGFRPDADLPILSKR
ncbi:MAG: hypothetical protein AAGF59_04810 [Pseudomonadota bacterium]